MKINKISNDSYITRNPKLNNSATINPIYPQLNPYDMFRVYSGKDLVAFRGGVKSFNSTLKENYFKLPENCYPDKFQIQAGKAIKEGKDVIVEAPTGTGKTAIAYYSASKNMNEGKKTIYTAPLKALSNQKLNEFKDKFGEDNIGIMTGDRRENIDAPILIMTTEVYRNMALAALNGEDNPITDNLGSVIFDEFHYMADESRGSVWEESVIFSPKNVQKIALSATIGNSDTVADWFNSINGVNTELVSIPESDRHVPLEFNSFETNSFRTSEKFFQKKLKNKGSYNFDNEPNISPKPTLSDFKYAVNQLDKKHETPAIFFVFSKRFSRELIEFLSEEGADLNTKEEKEKIKDIIDKYKSEKYIGSDIDEEALLKGYAIHNAGIIPAQKELIEELFQKKLVKVVIATETLAAGINMPAKTVVISNPYKPSDDNKSENELGLRLLTPNEFKQMAGRAGRRGIDTKGFVYTMPTDRNSQQDILYLQDSVSNPLISHYEPDYPFLTGYYEYNNDDSKLNNLLSSTFYVYDKNSSNMKNKVKELETKNQKKTNVLLERNFLTETESGISPTLKGKIASDIKGYDVLPLIETIAGKSLEGISPEGLAMFAGGIANPASPRENSIALTTDLSGIITNAQDNIDYVSRTLVSQINSNLKIFNKNIDDFDSYSELLKFAQNIDVPDVSIKEAKKDLNEKESIYKKASVITKQNRTYNIENVIYRIKNNLPVPSVVLDEFRTELVKYKKQMNQKNIDSYIEKLNSKINSLETSFQSKKVKDKHKKDSQELRQELNKAQQMKFLDDNITDVIAENYKFIKKYPVKKACNDYKKCKQTYSRLTLKTPLVSQIKGLMEIEDYNNYNDITEETMDNLYKISECYKQYCKNSMLVFNTEENNGIESKVQEPGRDSAQIAYNWALLNKIDSCSLTNWQKLIRILPEGFANEGTIYRQIMQTADLLGQIKDAADTGLENAESIDDINYYLNLAKTAKESRNLLLKSPVEI